jgi:hypothetical protein
MRKQFFLKSLVVVLSLAVAPVIFSIAQDRATHKPGDSVIEELPSAVPAMPGAASRMRVSEAYGKLPLHFEANQGQTDGQVKFLSRGSGYTLFLTPTEAVLTLRRFPKESLAPGLVERVKARAFNPRRTEQTQTTVLRMKLVGANRSLQVVGREELPGKANYFIGNDPAKWRTNIPTYKKVAYTDIYPGIDLIYYGNQRHLEYDLVVNPGADPTQIVLGFDGADRLEVDAQGDLVLHTAAGPIRQRKPVIFQEVDGVRKEIPGGYMLTATHQVGFRVAAYDATRPLVIDPTLVYSTYLGGSDFDVGFSIAVDAAGAAYVTGFTQSGDFPTACTAPCTVLDATLGGFLGGFGDAFVTKLNATGTALVYSTYLGGSSNDVGRGIAVDAAGAAYVTGVTSSADFTAGCTAPCTVLDGTPGSTDDAFVTKLNSSGSALVYSTYLGGSGEDFGRGIAVEAAGAAYVTGNTRSADFTAGCTAPCAVLDGSLGGSADAFVVKIVDVAEGCPPNDDEDKDGLLDANERLLGTLLGNSDSDGDGIRDGNDDANGNGKDDEDEDDGDECPDRDSDGDGTDDEDEDD